MRKILKKTKNSVQKKQPRKKAGEYDAEEVMKAAIEVIVRRTNKYAEAIDNIIALFEHMENLCKNEAEKIKLRQSVNELDETLERMGRMLSTVITIRSVKTTNQSLLCSRISEIFSGLRDLPKMWEKLTWENFNPNEPDEFGFSLLDSLACVLRFWEQDCKKHPERYRLWASEQPYLPFLQFLNKSANNARFSELISKLPVGEKCPIHVSSKAEFRDNPLNFLVLDALMDFLWAFGWIQFAKKGDPEKAWRKGAAFADQLEEQAGMSRALQPIYLAASDLPPLTKATAKKWADKILIPYFERIHPDWKTLDAFAPHIGKAGGRAKAKEAICDAVKALAKPSLS